MPPADATTHDRPLRPLCLDILEEGRRRFDAMLGIVSRISGDTYEIFAVSSMTGIPETGDLYALDAVYCREVVRQRTTVAITQIDGVAGMRLHPLYDTIPCEFYISSPIFLEGRVWGTLNFTSLEKRDGPFSPEDIAFNESRAARIAACILSAS
ncbi:MAG: GAF domain-containing protein [Rhodocyclaceae bacterium]|jgi:GAF domain-containing protein|nr:GAF domain-containing protein [Rhodocyclaceae bacterium]